MCKGAVLGVGIGARSGGMGSSREGGLLGRDDLGKHERTHGLAMEAHRPAEGLDEVGVVDAQDLELLDERRFGNGMAHLKHRVRR